ncbi:hypothetical protein K7I13_06200 [Brucepastera parasyntrophica]|uniref:hypothetical protein n=1 Tax=Brucepastera parasyntrophica TaxID=2880008 RepID=UPI00210AC2A4|nr:hypothetical protein [Brucepastera parasyntrophica]ULQ60854.1 hypothetical protein K7I13_06200 [Brucepastera parasyntrophica]
MKFSIYKLLLHKDISVPDDKPADDGTLEIMEYYSSVKKNNLEPDRKEHLLGEGKKTGIIPAGTYLFSQIPAGDFKINADRQDKLAAEEKWREVSEAIWLESLWMKKEFKNDRILVRILSEDSKTVFQIFREIIEEQK